MSESKGRVGRATPLFISAGVGLALGLILTGWVWYEWAATARMAAANCDARMENGAEDRADLESDLASMGDLLAAEEARGDIQEARILLARAITEIDDANFGTTDGLVDRAVGLLRQMDGEVSAVDPDVLSEVVADLERIHIRVSTDPARQRVALMTQTDRLDRALEL